MDNNKLDNKRLKHGTYSTVVAIVVVGILVIFNLIVGEFNRTFDFTENNLFSLTAESKEVINNVKSDVKIYTLFRTGNEEAVMGRVNQVIEKYVQSSRFISLENKDTYLHPDFTKKYISENTIVDSNSIIVESNNGFKVINYEEYFDANGRLSLESSLTSAIQYVNMENQPVIYYITGHGEAPFENFTSLNAELKLANYDVKSINLLNEDIPRGASMVLITVGQRDYSLDEANKLLNFLANDGRAYMILGGVDVNKFPNLLSIATAYGITIEDGTVLEGDTSNYLMYPYALLPNLTEHSINTDMLAKDYRVVAVASQEIKELDMQKQGLLIEPLLTTSNKAFTKAEGNNSANMETGDTLGKFNLAFAITDSTYTDSEHTTKLIITGASYYLIEPNTDSLVNGANTTFVLNGINWLNDGGDNISIPAKSVLGNTIIIDAATADLIQLISWGVLPFTLFLIGFIVWLVRRNK